MGWSQREYLASLRSERRAFAWVMRRYGGLTPAEAEEAVREHYSYQARGTPYRGLVFHEAWDWAMQRIYHDQYYLDDPEPAQPPDEYRALD